MSKYHYKSKTTGELKENLLDVIREFFLSIKNFPKFRFIDISWAYSRKGF